MFRRDSNSDIFQFLLNDDQMRALETYFDNLIGNAAKNITALKLAKALGISYEVAIKVLLKCKEVGLVNVFYTVRCPECGMLIKKVSTLKDITLEPFICYGCDEEIRTGLKGVETVCELTERKNGE